MDKMVTDYPEKLQAIMDEASHREFVRIYFKLLEYARPKKVRDTPVDFEEDNTLHIHVHTQQEEKTNNKILVDYSSNFCNTFLHTSIIYDVNFIFKE